MVNFNECYGKGTKALTRRWFDKHIAYDRHNKCFKERMALCA